MSNLINIHTYVHTYIHRMTRPDCAVMCNLINIHTYPFVASDQRFS